MANAVLPFDAQALAVAPGAVWLKHWLSVDEQRDLAVQCRAIMDGPAGGYVPTVRGGGRMHVRMVCLGRHWNPLTYRYEAVRSDYDHQPVAAVPDHWQALAARAAAAAGFDVTPDLAIINFYDEQGRMGLHQDKDEGAASIAAGAPVVSVSVGDSARFLFGGLKRRDPIEPLLLASGDVFVFGGQARLRYHGVSRIVPGSAPPAVGVSGRFNITFRRF